MMCMVVLLGRAENGPLVPLDAHRLAGGRQGIESITVLQHTGEFLVLGYQHPRLSNAMSGRP